MDLTLKKCIPCEGGGIVPLTVDEINTFLPQVPEWVLDNDAKKISRKFIFPDFKQALSFVNKVGDIAESEGHHPDIIIHYNQVVLELWTHAIGGLFENDFIVAAKINQLQN